MAQNEIITQVLRFTSNGFSGGGCFRVDDGTSATSLEGESLAKNEDEVAAGLLLSSGAALPRGLRVDMVIPPAEHRPRYYCDQISQRDVSSVGVPPWVLLARAPHVLIITIRTPRLTCSSAGGIHGSFLGPFARYCSTSESTFPMAPRT